MYDLLLFALKCGVIVFLLAFALVIIIRSIKFIVEMQNSYSDDLYTLEVQNIKENLKNEQELLQDVLISSNEEEAKALKKAEKKIHKLEKKQRKEKAKELANNLIAKAEKEIKDNSENPNLSKITESHKKVMFVVDFKGSVDAKEVEHLRRVVTLICQTAEESDEVLLRLESPGGTVNGYGLCAAELERIKSKKIKLTIAVDEVAASGGYMMACVADKIIAAPFAYIGSIGVVAEFPNFNKVLKKYDVDYEQVTAGEYKRTLTTFGENTDDARKKFKEELEEVHKLFKEHVYSHRPKVNIKKVATGEHWLAKTALDLGLVDLIMTSDEYILKESENYDVIVLVSYKIKKKKSLKSMLLDKEQLSDFLVLVIKKLNNLKNKIKC
ncbi:MAG: protease SohB [Succinivibrionaceae bacterium]